MTSKTNTTVYYNSRWSTENEQKELHALLPVQHTHGDRSSTLDRSWKNVVLNGKASHEAYASNALRIKTRKRCTVVKISLGHPEGPTGPTPTGPDGPLGPLDPTPKGPDGPTTGPVVCLLSVPDWHGVDLDAELLFLSKRHEQDCMPAIGPYSFYFGIYIASLYEDICMSFDAIKSNLTTKAHLKIIPLGVGPNIRTRFGDNLGHHLLPAYLCALQTACNEHINDTWVDTIEFVDHTRGTMCPYLNVKKVRIISASQLDVLDFSLMKENAQGVILAPCDAFCRIGGQESDKNIASTIANHSNMRQLRDSVEYVSWPTK